MKRKEIEYGERFGSVVVKRQVANFEEASGNCRSRYLVKCDCGNEVLKVQRDLTRSKHAYCSRDCKEKIK